VRRTFPMEKGVRMRKAEDLFETWSEPCGNCYKIKFLIYFGQLPGVISFCRNSLWIKLGLAFIMKGPSYAPKLKGRILPNFSKGEDWMPAFPPLEDPNAVQRDLLGAKNSDDYKATFRRWRMIRWENLCRLRF
jgi:hypothetical protein